MSHAPYRRVGDGLIEVVAILHCTADLAEGAADPAAALDRLLADLREDAVELLFDPET